MKLLSSLKYAQLNCQFAAITAQKIVENELII